MKHTATTEISCLPARPPARSPARPPPEAPALFALSVTRMVVHGRCSFVSFLLRPTAHHGHVLTAHETGSHKRMHQKGYTPEHVVESPPPPGRQLLRILHIHTVRCFDNLNYARCALLDSSCRNVKYRDIGLDFQNNNNNNYRSSSVHHLPKQKSTRSKANSDMKERNSPFRLSYMTEHKHLRVMNVLILS